jgi:DNA-binding transcriptional LysR family regulator
MEVRDICYFKVVAEFRNIGRAADALDLSATALSKSLRRLERGLGAKLVKRTARGVELTAVGSALAVRASSLQLNLDDLQREAADLTAGAMGRVSVTCAPGLCEYSIADAYTKLLETTVDVSLTTLVTDREQMWAALRSGRADFMVTPMRPTPVQRPDIECEEIFRDRWVIYASASHPLARRKRIILADLLNERWTMDTLGLTWELLCEQFQRQGLEQPKRILESNSLAMRLPIIASSRLLSIGARLSLQRAQRQYPLMELPVDGFDIVRGIGVYTRKDGYLSPAAKRMIEILKAQGKEFTSIRSRG